MFDKKKALLYYAQLDFMGFRLRATYKIFKDTPFFPISI